MKNNIEISKGMSINTLAGCIIIDDFNGHVVYCSEYEVDFDGDLSYVGARVLTLPEIAKLMKEVDGRNYNVVWKEEQE